MTKFCFFLQKQSVVVELLLMKKTQARLQQRCVSSPLSLFFSHQRGVPKCTKDSVFDVN
jgi:hypothetical protein